MSKISNIITMIELLQTGKKHSISELSNELEVTQRMIRTYKEDLEKAGIYIDTIMGPYGGYVLNQSVRMPLRKFNNSDVELLNKYIEKEKNREIKEQLLLLQHKIRGIYMGSKQETKGLNLREETKEKYNILNTCYKRKKKSENYLLFI